MLVGHFAAAMIGKRIEPRISVGTLVLAALLADLLCFVFLIAGLEQFQAVPGVRSNKFIGHNIVYSHSLLMGAVWGGLLAAAYFLRRRYPRGAWILFGIVLSHWVLDVISHRPDMPLAPGTSTVLGFGLWNSFPATVIVEDGLWLLAILLYVRSTKARGHTGIWAFWIGVALLTLASANNVFAGIDPNPVRAGIGGLIFFSLFTAWAYWINRLRFRP